MKNILLGFVLLVCSSISAQTDVIGVKAGLMSPGVYFGDSGPSFEAHYDLNLGKNATSNKNFYVSFGAGAGFKDEYPREFRSSPVVNGLLPNGGIPLSYYNKFIGKNISDISGLELDFSAYNLMYIQSVFKIYMNDIYGFQLGLNAGPTLFKYHVSSTDLDLTVDLAGQISDVYLSENSTYHKQLSIGYTYGAELRREMNEKSYLSLDFKIAQQFNLDIIKLDMGFLRLGYSRGF